MADPVLELDAAASNVDGTNPGTSMLLVDSSTGWGLISLDMPTPEPKLLWTSSVDMDGSLRADPGHYENRTVTASLEVARDTAALCQAQLRILGTKIGKIAREGGTLKVTWPSGNTFIFDLLAGSHNVAFDHAFVMGNLAQVTVTFTALPGARGAEQDLGDNTESTLPALVFTEASIPGDLSALGRYLISNSVTDQAWVQWGLETNALYTFTDSTGSGALFYQAESRTVLGGATAVAGPSGASGAGSNVVRQATLTTTDQAMLSTQATGGGSHLSHVGSFRVYARVQIAAANTGDVTLSFSWSVGDFQKVTTNSSVTFAEELWTTSVWRLVDLGSVTIPSPRSGATQRWEGRLLARSTVTGDDMDVDYLMFVPVSIGSGEASSVTRFQTPTTFSARDEFAQAAGALTGETLPVGGTWVGAGDADDFQNTGSTVTRTAVSDSSGEGLITGRVAIAGTTNHTNIYVQVFQSYTAAATAPQWGVFARYTDASNWLEAIIAPGSTNTTLQIRQRNAGTSVALASLISPTDSLHPAGVTKGMRLQVDDQGRAFLWLWTLGASPGAPILQAQSSALRAGGGLENGKVGFFDLHDSSAACTRTYDNFAAALLTKDAAMFSARSLEIGHENVSREDSTGTFWTPVSSYVGDYVRVPASGAESRSVRSIVKACRHNPETMPDPGIDAISAQLFVTPRYLNVPSA